MFRNTSADSSSLIPRPLFLTRSITSPLSSDGLIVLNSFFNADGQKQHSNVKFKRVCPTVDEDGVNSAYSDYRDVTTEVPEFVGSSQAIGSSPSYAVSTLGDEGNIEADGTNRCLEDDYR